jgi:predicted alpha/beta-fold hydrolase
LRNRHAQTVWGPFMRRERVVSRRERVVTPDGDFVDLDWLDARSASDAPLLLVLHGLEGSFRSHYVRGLLALARQARWAAVALNFRSCSGEPNRLPRFYHSGDTDDLDLIVRLLVERNPHARIGAVGISLGGNVLLKWLGEQAEATPKQIAAAVAISTPYDLERCARVLDQGFAKLTYTASFMRSFKLKLRLKAQRFPNLVDVPTALRARTFAQYDRAVTAPLHGFADERDYWRRASCRPYLMTVRRPTLLISAVDDPFVPPDALPEPAELSPSVVAEFTAGGGHVGFWDGPPWRPRPWAEHRAMEFLSATMAADAE